MQNENQQDESGKVCLKCGISIESPKRKFCCPSHKNQYNHNVIYRHKYTNAYRSKSPKNYIRHLRSYYKRHETLSLDFLVTLFETQQGRCAISGVPMTHKYGEGKCETNISIDRIDSSIGYTEENTQLVCARVNMMKQEYSIDNLTEWCSTIVDHQNELIENHFYEVSKQYS